MVYLIFIIIYKYIFIEIWPISWQLSWIILITDTFLECETVCSIIFQYLLVLGRETSYDTDYFFSKYVAVLKTQWL